MPRLASVGPTTNSNILGKLFPIVSRYSVMFPRVAQHYRRRWVMWSTANQYHDTNYNRGILRTNSRGTACCFLTCEKCGGSLCATNPGVAGTCCINNILKNVSVVLRSGSSVRASRYAVCHSEPVQDLVAVAVDRRSELRRLHSEHLPGRNGVRSPS